MTASSARLRWGATLATATLGLVFGLGVGPAFASGHTTDGGRKDNGGTSATTDAAPGSADRSTEAGGSGTEGTSGSNPDGGGVDKPYAAAGQDAYTQGDRDADGNNGCGNDTDFSDDNNGNCGGLHTGQATAHDSGTTCGEHADHESATGEDHESGMAEVHDSGAKPGCTGTGTGAAGGTTCEHADHESATGEDHESDTAEAHDAGMKPGCTDTDTDTGTGSVNGSTTGTGAVLGSRAISGTDTVTGARMTPAAVLGTELESAAPAALATTAAPGAQVLGAEIERGSSAPAAASGAAVLGATASRAAALAFTGAPLALLALVALALIAIGLVTRRASRQP